MTNQHVARPVRVALLVNGTYHTLGCTQVAALRKFDTDGVLHDLDPDVRSVRVLARHGWVQRSRGHFVLTPQGRDAQVALAAYYARKALALEGGAAS